MLDRVKVLEATERLIKKYNISPENIVADRSSLKWLFLSER